MNLRVPAQIGVEQYPSLSNGYFAVPKLAQHLQRPSLAQAA